MDDKTRELMFSSENQSFETPDNLFEKYREKYNIKIDVCATKNNTKCENFISPEQNMLLSIWEETGFMNPPYQKPESPCKKDCKKKKCLNRGWHATEYIPGQIDFVAHAKEIADRGLATTVCLLPARTDTKLFFKYIWDAEKNQPRERVKVEFLKGRLIFKGEKNAAPFPSMVVVFEKSKN